MEQATKTEENHFTVKDKGIFRIHIEGYEEAIRTVDHGDDNVNKD